MLPSRKLILFVVLAAVPLLFVGMSAGWLLFAAYNLALAAVIGLDLLITPRPDALCFKRQTPERLSLGTANRIGWEVHNRSGRVIAFEVTEDVPDGIEVDEPVVRGEIRPRSRAEVRYVARPTRRGRYEWGDIHYRYQSVLGLVVRRGRIRGTSAVKVYPNVANVGRYELAVRQHRLAEVGLTAAARRGQGSMFESLRDYVEGDDPADIAWKATARRGRPITRNFEMDRSQNVLIVLDCGRLMTAQVGELSRLDHAINATLLLTHVAAKQGDFVGLVAFSDRVERYVPPVRGRAAVTRMNEALYELEPRVREPNYEQACRFLALRHRKRSLIVIITDVIDAEASSMLLTYAARFARRHMPLCVTLRDLDVEHVCAARPSNAGDCFTKTVALQMQRRRAEALERMRRTGVSVLDVDPREMTPRMLNRYLMLKRRQRV